MSFKRLSIVAVLNLVALLLLFYPSPFSVSENNLTVGEVLAAATQNTITKKVVALTIQDHQIDLSNPDAPININLPGDPTTNIPIIITYDDGSTRYLAFTFNYQPPPQVQPSLPPQCTEVNQYNECISCNTSKRVSLDSCGNYSTIVEFQDDSGCASWCASSQPPPQQQRCEEIHLRNECVGCNESQKVYQKYCNGGISGDPYAGDRQYDSACSSWCASSPSQPPPEPPPPPPPSPSCNDDTRYCDENVGRIIHKHGGYWDGGSCQYAFDKEDPC